MQDELGKLQSRINLVHACILQADVFPKKGISEEPREKSKKGDKEHMAKSERGTHFTSEQSTKGHTKPVNIKIFGRTLSVINQVQ